MRDDVEIRTARPQDIDAVHRLETISFPAPWRREFFESELSGDSRLHFVARRNGRVVGYVFAMWFFDEMHVNKIAVEPDERRKGIALRLMNECIDFARRNRIETILSWRSRRSFASALSAYSLLSFGSLFSVLSLLSVGSAGSILSIGSSGSILRIGRAGSILSIGGAGSFLSVGGSRRDRNRL